MSRWWQTAPACLESCRSGRWEADGNRRHDWKLYVKDATKLQLYLQAWEEPIRQDLGAFAPRSLL